MVAFDKYANFSLDPAKSELAARTTMNSYATFTASISKTFGNEIPTKASPTLATPATRTTDIHDFTTTMQVTSTTTSTSTVFKGGKAY